MVSHAVSADAGREVSRAERRPAKSKWRKEPGFSQAAGWGFEGQLPYRTCAKVMIVRGKATAWRFCLMDSLCLNEVLLPAHARER